MIAIVTGDIIHSEKILSSKLLKTMKDFFKNYGTSPANWEIYRGDQFQLEITNPADALTVCILLKTAIKQLGETDVRMAIGLGEKSFNTRKITQSNGTAFVHSGRKFELLKKENINLAIQSDFENFDVEMNLFFRFASVFMDSWTNVLSEIVHISLSNAEKNQSEIAQLLGINQSAVSQRIKRANFDLLKDLIIYYQNQIEKLTE